MSFLLPGFFAACALIGLPFFLHLLRIEPKNVVPFPSLRFLGREALRDSRRHQITRWLLLLLRCLLIALVAIAFARPFWPFAHSFEDRSVVVVVDASASMQAKGRREAVEAWLTPQLDALRPPDRLGVLMLAPDPVWLVPLSRDLDSARDALRSLPQGFASVHYRTSLDLAGAVLAASPSRRKQILLAGDQQTLSWENARFERALPPGVDLLVAPTAPAPQRQAAVVAFRAERVDEGHLMVEAAVRGYAPAEDERSVRFFAGETLLGKQRFPLAAGQTQTVRAIFPVSNLGSVQLLRASLDPDDLTADDTGYAVLPPADGRSVMLSSETSNSGFDFLSAALKSARGAKLASLRIVPLPTAGRWPTESVAILRGPEPFRGESVSALDAFVAQGGSAWILCDGSAEQAAWLSRFGATVTAEGVSDRNGSGLRDLELDHPLFAAFAGHSILPLLEPVFHEAWKIEGEGIQPLARWPDHAAAIVEVPTGSGRLLVTGFGDTRTVSTFPTQAGFVPFVHQAASWLAESKASSPASAIVNTPVELQGSGTWIQRLGPGRQASVEVDESVTPTAPGIYELKSKTGLDYYAVNLDPSESDLAPWPNSGDFSRLVSTESAPLRAEEQADPLAAKVSSVNEHEAWWWLLAAAALLMMLELHLANRTAA